LRTVLGENDANAVIRPIGDENILKIVDRNARRTVERCLVAPRVFAALLVSGFTVQIVATSKMWYSEY
jgi:hypothetical protein